MPFDTIITIEIESAGTSNNAGEYTPGPSAFYEVWADQSGAGSSDALGVGGTVVVSGRTFLVRWFLALALAPESFVFIADNLGQRWYTDGINVSDARERYIVISSLRVQTALA